MGLELAKAWVSVRGDVSNLAGDLTGAYGPVDAVMNSIRFKINSVMSAIGALGYSFLDMGVRAAASQEQTVIAFETMMGSVQEAKKLLADLTHFAEVTPFEMPEITAAARGLVQFGERGEQLMDTLKILGNAASGANTDFSFLGLVFNQIRGVGHLLTQDFRQMSTRGVLSLQDIANYYHKTTAEAEKLVSTGKVGFEDVRKIFQALSAEGGRFHNLMEKQSKTLGGLWSTAKDAWHITGRLIATPLAEALKPVVDIMITMMDKAGPLVDAFQKGMGPVVDSWKALAKTIKDVIGAFDLKDAADTIKSVLKTASTYIGTFADAARTDWKKAFTLLGEIAVAELDIAWVNIKFGLFDAIETSLAGTKSLFSNWELGIQYTWLNTTNFMKDNWIDAWAEMRVVGEGVWDKFTKDMKSQWADFVEDIKRLDIGIQEIVDENTPGVGKGKAKEIADKRRAKIEEATATTKAGINNPVDAANDVLRKLEAVADVAKQKEDLEKERQKKLLEIVKEDKDRAAAIRATLTREVGLNMNAKELLVKQEKDKQEAAANAMKDMGGPFARRLGGFGMTGGGFGTGSEEGAASAGWTTPPSNLMKSKEPTSFAGILKQEQREAMQRLRDSGASLSDQVALQIQQKAAGKIALRNESRLLRRFGKKDGDDEGVAATQGSPFGDAFEKGGGMVGFAEYGKLLQNSILKAGAKDPMQDVAKSTSDMAKTLDESKQIQQKLLDKPSTMGLAAGT